MLHTGMRVNPLISAARRHCWQWKPVMKFGSWTTSAVVQPPAMKKTLSANRVASFHAAQINQNKSTPVLPALSDYPHIMWPSLWMTLQNYIYGYIIRTYMDETFDMKEFDRGARQAVSIVSQKLVTGKVDDLEGLVDSKTLAEIRQKLSTFSDFQRQLLAVDMNDIFFSFPYSVQVILPDPDPPFQQGQHLASTEEESRTRPPQTRHVEITVVFHILKNFLEKTKPGRWSAREFIESEERNNVIVCNYRFFRDFTKGVQNQSWIINMVNHFLPADHRRLR